LCPGPWYEEMCIGYYNRSLALWLRLDAHALAFQ
jgi:hypothetical protein